MCIHRPRSAPAAPPPVTPSPEGCRDFFFPARARACANLIFFPHFFLFCLLRAPPLASVEGGRSSADPHTLSGCGWRREPSCETRCSRTASVLSCFCARHGYYARVSRACFRCDATQAHAAAAAAATAATGATSDTAAGRAAAPLAAQRCAPSAAAMTRVGGARQTPRRASPGSTYREAAPQRQ